MSKFQHWEVERKIKIKIKVFSKNKYNIKIGKVPGIKNKRRGQQSTLYHNLTKYVNLLIIKLIRCTVYLKKWSL